MFWSRVCFFHRNKAVSCISLNSCRGVTQPIITSVDIFTLHWTQCFRPQTLGLSLWHKCLCLTLEKCRREGKRAVNHRGAEPSLSHCTYSLLSDFLNSVLLSVSWRTQNTSGEFLYIIQYVSHGHCVCTSCTRLISLLISDISLVAPVMLCSVFGLTLKWFIPSV